MLTRILLITFAAVVILLLGTIAFSQGHEHQMHQKQEMQQEQTKEMYTCPMHPEVVSDKPGKCPKCGMILIKMKPTDTSISKMMGNPMFEKSADGWNIKMWLMTQDEHKKMMKDRMDTGMMTEKEGHEMHHDKKDAETTDQKKDDDHSKMMEAMMAETHHIMVMATDEKSGKGVEETQVEIQITSPSNKTSIVKLMSMMGHSGGGLSLDEKGKYILTAVSTTDTKSVTTQFEYDVK